MNLLKAMIDKEVSRTGMGYFSSIFFSQFIISFVDVCLQRVIRNCSEAIRCTLASCRPSPSSMVTITWGISSLLSSKIWQPFLRERRTTWTHRRSVNNKLRVIGRLWRWSHPLSWILSHHQSQRFHRKFLASMYSCPNLTSYSECSVSFVLISRKLCMYSAFVNLTLLILFDSNEVWPEAKFAALGAFIFLRWVFRFYYEVPDLRPK